MVKESLTIGSTGERRFIASKQHSIDFVEDGMPAVLSTPWLIWFLEHSCRDAVLPHFDEGDNSVGVHIDVQHLAATPLGHEVVCKSRVIQRQGRRVWFAVEAFDENECIARGQIEMRIIVTERFATRLSEKQK